MSSINSASRLMQPIAMNQPVAPVLHHSQRPIKHGDACSSRSSVSSHSSAQHHHFGGGGGNTANLNGSVMGNYPVPVNNCQTNANCGHQNNMSSSMSSYAMQSISSNSSLINASESNSWMYPQQQQPSVANRGILNTQTCANPSMAANDSTNRLCQSSQTINNSHMNIVARNNGHSTILNSSRGGAVYSSENYSDSRTSPESSICGSHLSDFSGMRSNHSCPSNAQHHHHHHHHPHHHHGVHISPSSSLSSLQPFDSQNHHHTMHRCMSSHPKSIGVLPQVIASCHCSHHHRPVNTGGCVGCCASHHHHHVLKPNHHCSHNHMQAESHQDCSHGASSCCHQLTMPNNTIGDNMHSCNAQRTMETGPTSLVSGDLHHAHIVQTQQDGQIPNQCVDPNESLMTSTAHTHNLSNSSTTTHTSNMAVKHQPQFHRVLTGRAGQSNSSLQQFEQYGLSSAASTSSATASLSNFPTPAGCNDLGDTMHNRQYAANKMHQPLPPPPPPQSVSNQRNNQPVFNHANMFVNVKSENPIVSSMATTFIENESPQRRNLNNDSQNNPSTGDGLPPLPPKRLGSSSAACNSMTTTIHTTPIIWTPEVTTTTTQISDASSVDGQHITRVTSQAGVQNPLPQSDIPPPLPPINPGSRITSQQLAGSLNSSLTSPLTSLDSCSKQSSITNSDVNNPLPEFANLNLHKYNNNPDHSRSNTLLKGGDADSASNNKQLDALGSCAKCFARVLPDQEACKAMNQIYHASCFVCCVCNQTLLGKKFYPVGDKVYCETDFKMDEHTKNPKNCAACSRPIFNMVSAQLHCLPHTHFLCAPTY